MPQIIHLLVSLETLVSTGGLEDFSCVRDINCLWYTLFIFNGGISRGGIKLDLLDYSILMGKGGGRGGLIMSPGGLVTGRGLKPGSFMIRMSSICQYMAF